MTRAQDLHERLSVQAIMLCSVCGLEVEIASSRKSVCKSCADARHRAAVSKHKRKLQEVQAVARDAAGIVPTSLTHAVRCGALPPAPSVAPSRSVDSNRNPAGIAAGVEFCLGRDGTCRAPKATTKWGRLNKKGEKSGTVCFECAKLRRSAQKASS